MQKSYSNRNAGYAGCALYFSLVCIGALALLGSVRHYEVRHLSKSNILERKNLLGKAIDINVSVDCSIGS